MSSLNVKLNSNCTGAKSLFLLLAVGIFLSSSRVGLSTELSTQSPTAQTTTNNTDGTGQILAQDAPKNQHTLEPDDVLVLAGEMVDALEQFVLLDVPFRRRDRLSNIGSLRERLPSSDNSVADTFRAVLNAYLTEAHFGYTIEKYKGAISNDAGRKSGSFLRVGRVSYVFSNQEEAESFIWDADFQDWVSLPTSFEDDLNEAIRAVESGNLQQLMLIPLVVPPHAGFDGLGTASHDTDYKLQNYKEEVGDDTPEQLVSTPIIGELNNEIKELPFKDRIGFVTRAFADELFNQLEYSVLNAQFPSELESLKGFLGNDNPPDLNSLEELWTLSFRILVEQGKLVTFAAQNFDAVPQIEKCGENPGVAILRVGIFTAVLDGRLVVFDPESNKTVEPRIQPGPSFMQAAKRMEKANSRYILGVIDPTGGEILRAHNGSAFERWLELHSRARESTQLTLLEFGCSELIRDPITSMGGSVRNSGQI